VRIDRAARGGYIPAMRAAARRLVGVIGITVLAAALAACQPASRTAIERESADVPIFAPTTLRIHPFTSVKDWTGDNRNDGIEALIELQDRFRDPTKATGVALFELYEYRRNYPDPRGDRLAAWRGSVQTLEEQRMHWNRISRTYSFQLAFPPIRADKSYVLQVWFDQGGQGGQGGEAGHRLTSQIVLEAQEASGATTPATTIPVTQPATRPTGDGGPAAR
jgi:hypothetical protein